jgi:hypothetical protein
VKMRLAVRRYRVVACAILADLMLVLVATGASAFAGEVPETPHLAFVTEYMRELAAVENIRASAEKEQSHGTRDEKLLSAIHANTLFQLELRSQIGTLKRMHLNNAPYDQIIPDLIRLDEMRVGYYQRIIDITSEFLDGPKPGVDYGKMLAELPQIRAVLEDMDHTLFAPISPLIFSTLIDTKADSRNHVSHLIITKAERTKLIDQLTGDFGTKLDQTNQNYTISSAQILKSFLKEHKCSDEPWE